ncbi:XP_014780801.1PREDICTED: uncharacterized protein LOC106876682 [Octopus vulgaris]|uniref:XP_014780801.1PREDICTED: uncharacterized protein LOC106876682 n=1 Tax=Octopus vulgaris TaxID=6645 RepID=A0AA36BJ28_OCTVU|nr:XP_014780801.1PREDICTED: uncharacterized protein LOC106876682 [Octopus vulgaris]
MAIASVSNLSLQCKICWRNSTKPQKLFCGHTFCFSCINYFTQYLVPETGFNDSLTPCPICDLNALLCININTEEKILRTYSKACDMPNRRTGLDYWFDQKSNTRNPKLSLSDTHSPAKSVKIKIPLNKLKNNTSEMSVNGDSISRKRGINKAVCAANSTKSSETNSSDDGNETLNLKFSDRSKKVLDNLETAEIKFLQPDFINDITICPEGAQAKQQRLNKVCCPSDNLSFTYQGSTETFHTKKIPVFDATFMDDSSISDPCSLLGSTDQATSATDCSFDFNLFENYEIFSANSDYNSVDVVLDLKTDSTLRMSTDPINLIKCNCVTDPDSSIFCITCQCSLCFFCIIEKHQNCQIRMNKDLAIRLTQQLEIKTNVLEIVTFEIEEQIEQYKKKCLNLCKVVNQLTNFIINLIKYKHDTLIEELDKSRDFGLKKLTLQYSKIEKVKTILSSYSQMLKSKIEETMSPAFLEVEAPVIKDFKNNTKSLYLQPLFELNMFVIRSFLDLQAHPFGYIKVKENLDLPLSRSSVSTPFPHNSNILEECLKECSPRKLIVCGTKCGTETNAHTEINSVAILPKHRVLLSSPQNYQVKLFSFQGTLLGELTFSTPPVGVCLWKEAILLVTFPHDSKILLLSYEPNLEIDIRISTRKGYFGLASGKGNNSDYLFATVPFSTSVDILEFDQVNQEFLVFKQISLNVKPWGYACNLCQASDETIVVADCFGNRVLAFNWNGRILYEIYGDSKNQLKCPADVTSDNFSIFVSDVGSNRILCFDFDGRSMNVLLTSQDGLLRPKSIDIDAMGYLAVSQFTEWPALIIFQTIKQ